MTFELNHYFHTSYGDANLDTFTDFIDFQALLDHWQYVVIDCGPGFEPPPGPRFELYNASGSGIEIVDSVSGEK